MRRRKEEKLAGGEQLRMGTNAKNRPYCELGKMLDTLARERNVRGPYNIAIRSRTPLASR